VILSIIAASPDEVNAAEAVFVSYMGNYSSVDTPTCQRLQEEVSKGQ